jgi:Nitroreductase
MELFEAIRKRRAVRKYKSDPVSKEDILKVLDAANQAPSAMNMQQWYFVVVTGERIKAMAKNYRGIVEQFARARNTPFNETLHQFSATYGGAPALIVVLTDTADSWDFRRANLESASAAMENLVLAATALGLGTCWMTGPLNDEKFLRAALGIPDDREFVAVTPIGYPEAVPEASPRRDPKLTAKVRWLD